MPATTARRTPRRARHATSAPAARACRAATRWPGAARAGDTARMDLTLIELDSPTEVRTFHKGRFEVYRVGPMTIGRATYEPGWKWSAHVGAPAGETSCQVEHVGLVLSGQAAVKMDDGTEK